MAQPTLLLKGSFDSFSIDDVLEVVGLSRQTMKVVLDDSGRGGEFLVKAGRVIQAAAPPMEGRRAFVNIYREPGQGFAVWQHVEATGEPIGLLADLIAEAKTLEQAPAIPNRMPMLAGTFADHRLDEVLDVLNMTRQLVEFKVMREDDSRVTMILKAGQVLACEDERQSTSGLSAFRTLFADPGTHFEVVRLSTPPDDLPPPIGRLPALVQQALKEDAQAGKKRAGVLFQGAFQNFPLSDVLEALSVTRLTVEMVFHDSDGTRGTFVLKAGQVLAAQALRTGASGRDAFLELMAEPGEGFVVVRRPGVPATEPIGQLREMLAQARVRKTTMSSSSSSSSSSANANVAAAGPLRVAAPAVPAVPAPPPVGMTGPGRGSVTRAHTPVKSVPPPPPATVIPAKPVVPKADPVPRIVAAKAAASTAAAGKAAPGIEIVLDGTFDRFSIEEVLQVLSISRQYVALGTLRKGVPLARLVVKSGRLLMASYGSIKDPVEAMTMLLGDPGTEFRVRRLTRYADQDLGSLAEIAQKARQAQPAAEPATLLHLPKPKPAAEPEPAADDIDLDDLFEEEPAPVPAPVVTREPDVEIEAKARAKARVQARREESKAAALPVAEAQPEAKPEPKPEAKPKGESRIRTATRPYAPRVAAPKPVAARVKPLVETPPAAVEERPSARAAEPVAATPEPVVVTPEPVVVTPEPVVVTPEPVVVTPEPVAATPEPVVEVPVAARVDTGASDAIVRSLALIEERLRAGAPATTRVAVDDGAIDALKSITAHLEVVSRSMESLGGRMDTMAKETKKMTSRTNTVMGVVVLLLSFVIILGALAMLVTPPQ